MLKIEEGKRYVDRNGIVRGPITRTGFDPDFHLTHPWTDGQFTWRKDGRYLVSVDEPDILDLISEYKEPVSVESPIDDEILTQTTCPLEMLQPQKSVRVAQFDAEIATVTQRRGAVYGHPRVDFDRAARLKAVVAECADPVARHALEMICVKMARLITTPDHLDSWVDIVGYARTGVMGTDPAE